MPTRTTKTVADYKKAAALHGGDYILDIVPRTVKDVIEGWKCGKNHIFKMRYDAVMSNNSWCKICTRNIRTIEDYKKEVGEYGGEYIMDHIPKNMNVTVKNGWRCSRGHIVSTSLASIEQGSFCGACGWNKKEEKDYVELALFNDGKFIGPVPPNSRCSTVWECKYHHQFEATWDNITNHRNWCSVCNDRRITLEQYQSVARENNGEYILDHVPSNTKIRVSGWKCSSCNEIFTSDYNHIKSVKRWCNLCSKSASENAARKIFERIFGEKFINTRPRFLRGMELDGYCEKIQLAFEYNGAQHYRYVPFFHQDEKAFENCQKRDISKLRLCKEQGIKLVVIPDKYDYTQCDKMEVFIRNELIEQGLPAAKITFQE